MVIALFVWKWGAFDIFHIVDSFSRRTLDYCTRDKSSLRSSRNLLRGIVRFSIYVIGLLVILCTLGISIMPIIASLGIGSLTVALALQPTLDSFDCCQFLLHLNVKFKINLYFTII